VSATWGPYAAALLLLLYAGAPKALDPAETLRAARDLRLPLVTGPGIRLFGVAEVGLGVAGLAVGGAAVAALVAATYVGFAVVTTIGVLRPGVASCGCFSGDESPPSVRHVVVDLVLAGAAGAAAVAGAPSLLAIARDHSVGTTVALSVLAVVDALLAYVVLARFPVAADAAPDRATLWSDAAQVPAR
jgi:methylamine utilization protein MauE